MSTSQDYWIDHRRAFVVMIVGKVVSTHTIESHAEAHVRHTGGSPEDTTEHRIEGELDRFYDEVIERVRGAEGLLILGPGEAKGELRARLDRHKHSIRMVDIETVDKMSDSQVVTRVRKRFQH
jgi:hypothetical protein